MKFRITIRGNDSIDNGIADAASQMIEDSGGNYTDARHDALCRSLASLACQFLLNGCGGNDAVTVEFDTEKESCHIVPIKDWYNT